RHVDARADRVLQPAAGKPGDALLQEDIEALAAIGLSDEEHGARLAHGRPFLLHERARRIARLASRIGSPSSSSGVRHSHACPVPETTSPGPAVTRNTWRRTVRSG